MNLAIEVARSQNNLLSDQDIPFFGDESPQTQTPPTRNLNNSFQVDVLNQSPIQTKMPKLNLKILTDQKLSGIDLQPYENIRSPDEDLKIIDDQIDEIMNSSANRNILSNSRHGAFLSNKGSKNYNLPSAKNFQSQKKSGKNINMQKLEFPQSAIVNSNDTKFRNLRPHNGYNLRVKF